MGQDTYSLLEACFPRPNLWFSSGAIRKSALLLEGRDAPAEVASQRFVFPSDISVTNASLMVTGGESGAGKVWSHNPSLLVVKCMVRSAFWF